jgi:hypothetical protein
MLDALQTLHPQRRLVKPLFMNSYNLLLKGYHGKMMRV